MQISYLGPRMAGGTSTFQQWSITPLSSNQYWGPNDVIKIMGNISEGLVDFYRTHIEFQVEVTKQSQPIGLIQVDNSAQSFINQTVLLSNQVQIQRIQQYDVLAAALTDLGFSQWVCQSRSGEGLGYNNFPTGAPGTLAKGGSHISVSNPGFEPSNPKNPGNLVQYNNGSTFSPVMASQYPGAGFIGNLAAYDDAGQQVIANTLMGGTAGGNYQSSTNWVTYPFNDTFPNNYVSQMGRAMSVRSQYLLLSQNGSYPDAPYSIPLTAPKVMNQTWKYTTMLGEGFNPSKPYQISYPTTMQSIGALNYGAKTGNCGLTGYSKPFSPEFARGTNQPVLSATIPQVQMSEGKILPTPVPLRRKTFRMPLISAILGILIPPDQFQLIPAQSLKNILLQITLNPFACFTGGYSDIHQFDSIGMQPQNMQKRRWQFNNFQWVWHLYTFNNSQIQASINAKLYKGILISTNYWQLTAQYQLPNGSYCKNSFQIPSNVQSLAQVLTLFLSNEYQTKSFCRKQFRLSNNITAMQLKANGSYYPLQPIQGNAGNPQITDLSSEDNWNFYQLVLLSNNFLFNTNIPMPKINQKNFAINGRIYDTDNVATFLDPKTMYRVKTAANYDAFMQSFNNIPTQPINPDTALGQCWFHQNRYVGKALYSYTFEPYGHSKGMIHGLDTRGYRQFDIIFNNSPTNVNPHDQTMLIFTRANAVAKFTPQGISVLGV